ncbi:MAG: hypothetical protein ACYC7F_06665, partial [Gemmatimonadaceae bacterium]
CALPIYVMAGISQHANHLPTHHACAANDCNPHVASLSRSNDPPASCHGVVPGLASVGKITYS